MLIDLDINGYLKIKIQEQIATVNKTEPIRLNDSKSKVVEMQIYEDTKTTYNFENIQDHKGQILVFETEFFDLLEVFNAYLAKQLNNADDAEIVVSYKSGKGFKAKIAQKQGKESLMIQVGEERYFFDKYTCRVIANKAKHYFSKCR